MGLENGVGEWSWRTGYEIVKKRKEKKIREKKNGKEKEKRKEKKKTKEKKKEKEIDLPINTPLECVIQR